jgi:hypothetical protein
MIVESNRTGMAEGRCGIGAPIFDDSMLVD